MTKKRGRYHDQMDYKHSSAGKYAKTSLASRVTSLERKEDRNYHKNTDHVAFTIATTPSAHYMSGIARGTAVDERSGDSINVTSFAARYVVRLPEANTSLVTQKVVRVVILQWIDGTGEKPLASEVFERTPYYLSPLNTQHGKEYKVLSNKMICLDAYNRNHVIELFWTSKRMVNDGKINYIGDTTNEVSGGKNGLFAMVMTNEATNAPVFEIISKLSYLD